MITLKELKEPYNNGNEINISEEDKREFASKFKSIENFQDLDDDSICSIVILMYFSWIQENENEKLLLYRLRGALRRPPERIRGGALLSC